MVKIFFASRNKAKYPYFKKYLSVIKYSIETPYDIPNWPDFEEIGQTMIENAEIKAINWSNYTDGIVLAEDCGFEIPSLKSWKKVLSERNLGGEAATDDEKRNKFLEIMQKFKGEDRRIIWTTAIALAKNGKLIGSISVDNPSPSYIVNELSPNVKRNKGEFLSCLEYKSQFKKIYTELSNDEIEIIEKPVFNVFREFIKENIK